MGNKYDSQIEKMKSTLEQDPSSLESIKQQAENLVAMYPNDVWIFAEIGGVFDSNGFEHDACLWYERALEFGFDRFPQDQAPHFCVWYGSTLRNVGRFSNSESVIRSALERWPRFSALQFFLGLTLMSQGKSMDAIVAFASLSAGEWDNSIQDYRRAVSSYLEEELVPSANRPCLSAVRLVAKNVRESAAWYASAFGASTSMLNDDFALLICGSAQLEIALHDEKNPLSEGGTIAYWSVPSLKEWQKKMEQAGAVLYRGPLEIRQENLIICQMKDPFGGVFGLRSGLSGSDKEDIPALVSP